MQNGSRYIESTKPCADGLARPPEFQVRSAEIEYVVNHAGARALMFDAAFVDTYGRCEPSYPPSTPLYHHRRRRIGNPWIRRLGRIGTGYATSVPADLSGCFFQAIRRHGPLSEGLRQPA